MEGVIIKIIDCKTIRWREENPINRGVIQWKFTRIPFDRFRFGHFRLKSSQNVLDFFNDEIVTLQDRAKLFIWRFSLASFAIARTVQVCQQKKAINRRGFAACWKRAV